MYGSAPCECLQMPEEGVGSPRIEVTDDCELSCGCWTSDPISGRAAVLLTTEPSLQAFGHVCIKKYSVLSEIYCCQ